MAKHNKSKKSKPQSNDNKIEKLLSRINNLNKNGMIQIDSIYIVIVLIHIILIMNK